MDHRTVRREVVATMVVVVLTLLPWVPAMSQVQMDPVQIQALHALVETKAEAPSFVPMLYANDFLRQTIWETLIVERYPDAILFANLSQNTEDYILIDSLGRTSSDFLQQGSVLGLVTLDDGTGRRYRVSVESFSPTGGTWTRLVDMTSLISSAGEHRLPLTHNFPPGIPAYMLRISYFRVETPTKVRVTVETIPGLSIPYSAVSIGVLYGLGQRAAIDLTVDFDQKLARAVHTGEQEIADQGGFFASLSLPRDDRWQATPWPWRKEYYRGFFQRFAAIGGLGFLKARPLQQWLYGLSYRLWAPGRVGGIDFVAGRLSSQRAINGSTIVFQNPSRAGLEESLFPSQEELTWFFGVSVPIMQFGFSF